MSTLRPNPTQADDKMVYQMLLMPVASKTWSTDIDPDFPKNEVLPPLASFWHLRSQIRDDYKAARKFSKTGSTFASNYEGPLIEFLSK